MSTPRTDERKRLWRMILDYADLRDDELRESIVEVLDEHDRELQAKDREIERLREALDQVSYQPGSDKFASIEYCFFCSYSRDWIAKNGHGNTCPLHQEST